MTTELMRGLLDACFLAKKITETMPPLPAGLTPRHIHVITSIAELGAEGRPVRVSDVSGDLAITMPSVTKLIAELTDLNLAEKHPHPEDGRATILTLTETGHRYHQIYVTQYHGWLARELKNLTPAACRTTISTIEALYRGVSTVSEACAHDL